MDGPRCGMLAVISGSNNNCLEQQPWLSFSFRVKGFGYPVLFNIYVDQGGSCSREKPGSFLETTHEATGGKRILSEAGCSFRLIPLDHRFICPLWSFIIPPVNLLFQEFIVLWSLGNQRMITSKGLAPWKSWPPWGDVDSPIPLLTSFLFPLLFVFLNELTNSF